MRAFNWGSNWTSIPRTPHFKGTVESFFGGLNDQLSASLPGRTFRNWADRADYKPDDGPLLSYEALLEILHIYLVDVYSITKHPAAETSRLRCGRRAPPCTHPCFPPLPKTCSSFSPALPIGPSRPGALNWAGCSTHDDLMALRPNGRTRRYRGPAFGPLQSLGPG